MTRKECLEKAMECVLKNRQDQYGDAEDCFGMIAGLWSAYLAPAGVEIDPYDVACMMALLKVARIQANPKHGDSWVDLAGYAACGAELAVPEPSGLPQPEAQAGDGPAYKPAYEPFETVQVKWHGKKWVEATFLEFAEMNGGMYCCVSVSGTTDCIPIDRVRKMPEAEGVEELVVSPFDAPQTPDAVCRHIVDCNPSVFKPRTPTGEELAEMAEEDANEQ